MLLNAKELSFSYDTLLFSKLNLSLDEGESLAIRGASGCGKSTLLHILSSLLKPFKGQVFYKDQDIYALSEDERLLIRRLDFGIIFQSHYLFKGFLAYENIELASILSGQEIDLNICEELGILSLIENKITKLSGGEQQRTSIARVLCKKPRLIFADEPTGNLDPKNAINVMKILKTYVQKQGAALVFITHDEYLASFCDKELLLS